MPPYVNGPLEVHIRQVYTSFSKSYRVANIWQAFLACLTVRANKFYFYRKCMYMYLVFILQCQTSETNAKFYWKVQNQALF